MPDLGVSAVVVTYEPDLSHLGRALRLLLPQVAKVVVVDNGSTNQPQLRGCLADLDSVVLVANPGNRGIAAALNQGIRECSSDLSCDWVLTLDQDSLVPPGFVRELGRARGPKVAVVAPHVVDKAETEDPPEGWRPRFEGHEAVAQAITSGALTSVAAWRDIGGFDDSMFIDLVDFDFCARARRAGWEIRRARGVALWHQLGRLVVRSVLGRTVRVTNHAAWRNRQYARNTVYLARKLERRWWPPALWRSLAHRAIKATLFERNRVAGVCSLVVGLRDGLRTPIAHGVH